MAERKSEPKAEPRPQPLSSPSAEQHATIQLFEARAALSFHDPPCHPASPPPEPLATVPSFPPGSALTEESARRVIGQKATRGENIAGPNTSVPSDKTRSAELSIALERADARIERAFFAVIQLQQIAEQLRSDRWGLELLESLGLQIIRREHHAELQESSERPGVTLYTEARVNAARAAVASMDKEIKVAQALVQKELPTTASYIRRLQFGIDIEVLTTRTESRIDHVNIPATILLSGDSKTLWVMRRDALVEDDTSGTDDNTWRIDMSNISAASFGPTRADDKSTSDKLSEINYGLWRALSFISESPGEKGSCNHATEYACRAVGDSDALAIILGIFAAKGIDVKRTGIRARMLWSSARMRLHHRAYSGVTQPITSALAELLKDSSDLRQSSSIDASCMDSCEELLRPCSKVAQDGTLTDSFTAWSPARSNGRLSRAQCRAKVLWRLKVDGKDLDVSDTWIDRCFDRFDWDKSGYIEDCDWSAFVTVVTSTQKEDEQTENDHHAVSTKSAQQTLKRKQEQIESLLTMLEAATLENAVVRDKLERMKKDAAASQAALQTKLLDNRNSYLDSLEEMQTASSRMQLVHRTELADLKAAHTDSLAAASDSFEQQLAVALSRHSAQVQQKNNEMEILRNQHHDEMEKLQTFHTTTVEQMRVELAEHREAHREELRVVKDSYRRREVALRAGKVDESAA